MYAASQTTTLPTRQMKNIWIPGDWGRINNGNKNSGVWADGLEGENIIYVGKGKFWGHFSDKIARKPLTGAGSWFEQIEKAWVNNVGLHAKPELDDIIRFSPNGIKSSTENK